MLNGEQGGRLAHGRREREGKGSEEKKKRRDACTFAQCAGAVPVARAPSRARAQRPSRGGSTGAGIGGTALRSPGNHGVVVALETTALGWEK